MQAIGWMSPPCTVPFPVTSPLNIARKKCFSIRQLFHTKAQEKPLLSARALSTVGKTCSIFGVVSNFSRVCVCVCVFVTEVFPRGKNIQIKRLWCFRPPVFIVAVPAFSPTFVYDFGASARIKSANKFSTVGFSCLRSFCYCCRYFAIEFICKFRRVFPLAAKIKRKPEWIVICLLLC